jgi:NTE family protein
MESFIGDQTFQDLLCPIKIVATSITTSQEVVFESGRVVDALRASISITGIFRPLVHHGEVLIDGGNLNPLPDDVLTKMGVKKIIAVDVLSSPDDRSLRSRLRAEKRKHLQQKREGLLWRRFLNPITQRISQHFSNNIFNVIMSTIQIMEYEIAQVAGQEADVLICPVVHDAHWAEFYNPDKFIHAGEAKTLEQIDEIKRLLVE